MHDLALINAIIQRSETTLQDVQDEATRETLTALFALIFPIVIRDERFKYNLQKMIDFDDFNFAHDVVGILNHFDVETMRIERGFLPRCAHYVDDTEE